MKTVLIVAYDFPPRSTSGVYRPLKFAKYLPEFGWRPVILTVSNYPHDIIDETLVAELPECAAVYRAHSIEPKRWEEALFHNLYRKPAAEKPLPAATTDVSAATSEDTNEHRGFSLKGTIKKLVFSPLSHFSHDYLYTPDEHVGWVPMAVAKGLQAIRSEQIDAIITTSPPETNHLVGLWLKRLTGKPWIADFRDPWSDNFMKKSRPKARVNLERRMERKVLRKADIILHVGERMAQLSQSSFPEFEKSKHASITNGYDESDYRDFDAARIYRDHQAPHLSILNVGTVYEDSAMMPLLTAYQNLVSKPEFAHKMKLTFIGKMLDEHTEAVSVPQLKDHVSLTGFIPHHDALHTMMASDVILLMPAKGDVNTNDKIIPGKLFELLRAGRPILMLGWEGESADMVRRSGTGIFVPAEDTGKIEEALRELVRRKQTGQLQTEPNWSYIRQYDRKVLTGRLAQLLDSLTNGQGTQVKQDRAGQKVTVS
ncbi:MAG: glycosyltransferase [Candidatus Zixiibacteriota bacterium]